MANVELGGIALPDGIMWVDRQTWTATGGSVKRALSGNLIVSANTITGRPITLDAKDTRCWIPRDTVEAIQSLANQPRAVYTLKYYDEEFQVRFRHEESPIEFTPLLEKPVYSAEDYFYGTIRLMEV